MLTVHDSLVEAQLLPIHPGTLDNDLQIRVAEGARSEVILTGLRDLSAALGTEVAADGRVRNTPAEK